MWHLLVMGIFNVHWYESTIPGIDLISLLSITICSPPGAFYIECRIKKSSKCCICGVNTSKCTLYFDPSTNRSIFFSQCIHGDCQHNFKKFSQIFSYGFCVLEFAKLITSSKGKMSLHKFSSEFLLIIEPRIHYSIERDEVNPS